MLRPLIRSSVLASNLLLFGCGTMYLDAPADQSITLLHRYAPTTVRIEQPIWFKWWGGQAIDDPHTATIIQENQLKEVRLYMTNTFVDGLYNIIPGIFGFPRRTLIVEGNRK